MKRIRLKEASLYWHDYIKKAGEPRKLQKQAAENIGTSENYMTRLSNGSMPTVRIDLIPGICNEFVVDANFLFGTPLMKMDDVKIKILEDSLRMNFDHKGTDKDECRMIIELSESLNLSQDFIDELKSDYYSEYSERY